MICLGERTGNLDMVLLLLIFLFTSAAILLFGLQVSRQIEENMDDHFRTATPFLYLVSRARQHDEITLTPLRGDTPSLFLPSEYDETGYATYLYYYGGGLYELFIPTDISAAPADGQLLLQTDPISFQLEGSLISVTCTDSTGHAGTLFLLL